MGGNAFTTGSVDLVAAPATAAITMAGMAPGDQVTAPVNVANSGTLEFRYSITSTTDEDTLAAELDLTVKSGVTTCDNAGFGVDGTVLYTGPLGSTATINVVGTPATGAQAGDRVLATAANENLCFNVALPTATSNAFQGLSSTATFTFDAEQTANNPLDLVPGGDGVERLRITELSRWTTPPLVRRCLRSSPGGCRDPRPVIA